MLAVDEIHLYSNPDTWAGYVIRQFAETAKYIGLTGTPVSNSPAQLAHMAYTLNAKVRDRGEDQDAEAQVFLTKTATWPATCWTRRTLRSSTSALWDRVDKSFLKLTASK